MLGGYAGHNSEAVTHPKMKEYFNCPQAYYDLPQYGANIFIAFATERAQTDIIGRWVACALTKECMGPANASRFCFHISNTYSKCHRYDQAAINILLSSLAEGNVLYYHYAYRKAQFLSIFN